MNDTKDLIFLKRALELAKLAETQQEVPIGAVLVLNNEIIGEGWNQPISANDPTAHAEIIALRAGAKKIDNYRLLDTTLYVTIEPCTMCIGAMVHARVKRLVFGADDPKAGAVKSVLNLLDAKHFNHKIAWQSGLLDENCANLLKRFFAARRN